ncbi:hypothetical protein IE077_001331 [Cardiosporidium cionae]|uniref:Protein kinase domain-containing protein n=1 Tax=Cardiosporidium cionae TaxID=476202 RepID=A0ABQ7J5I1_9APIC|nr:hypothetical protein IE077_001331 [Cardiosporidium cionae]|eukprot:KAF8819256.1 hypothetical protein IE077_001331 [Cardiosporidium cionae]
MKSASHECTHKASCKSIRKARNDENEVKVVAREESLESPLHGIENAPRFIWKKYTWRRSSQISSDATQIIASTCNNSDLSPQYSEGITKRHVHESPLETDDLDLMEVETHKLHSESNLSDLSLRTLTTGSTAGSSIEDNDGNEKICAQAAHNAEIFANSTLVEPATPYEANGRYATCSSTSSSTLHIDPSTSGLLLPMPNQVIQFLPLAGKKSTSTKFQTSELLEELSEIEHENKIRISKFYEDHFLRYLNEDKWNESHLPHRNVNNANWMGVGAWVSKLLHGKAPDDIRMYSNALQEKAPPNDKLSSPKVENLRNYHSERIDENGTTVSEPRFERSTNKFHENVGILNTAVKEESINHLSAQHIVLHAEQSVNNAAIVCRRPRQIQIAKLQNCMSRFGSRSDRKSKDCSVLHNGILMEGNPRYFCTTRRFHDSRGPVAFFASPRNGMQAVRGELRLWHIPEERVIGQNSSKRRVHKAHWMSSLDQRTSFPAAIKFVEDCNNQDGRSLKREIECHLYIYEHLLRQSQNDSLLNIEDAWPCSELFAYYLDKKQPGNCVLITRKLSGPDFFNIIRSQHSCCIVAQRERFEYHKLRWCILALEKVAQYSSLGIRHNDIKPDNIVLDIYTNPSNTKVLLDVKIIDLGTASLEHAKDYTGGTSWYESPEQRRLEYFTKKCRNPEEAKKVEIGLKSDTWGAGLSITEVLLGRRVVDCMKESSGTGPLEYLGHECKWAVEPADWVNRARRALGIENELTLSRCGRAARFVYDCLVQPEPDQREPLCKVIETLYDIAEEAKRTVPAEECHLGVSALTSELQAACRIVHP